MTIEEISRLMDRLLSEPVEDEPVCDMCQYYGRPGWIINAHQWVPCFQCNPNNEKEQIEMQDTEEEL